jgi:FixJ family two-component response regulator
MAEQERPRILVVDDEEAILETMTFTFEDDYDVLTASSASDGLAVLEREGPVAAVISDQRMPEMTGVEFLAEVFERHPTTVRMILTGFADMDATIGAINAGHVYAYITKPWEPADLKQVVRRAVEHHELARENERLLAGLRDANVFLEAVMDELDTGAVAIDADGIVRAINRPARTFLGVDGDARGRRLEDVLGPDVWAGIDHASVKIETDEHVDFEEVELPVGKGVRLRVAVRELLGPEGRPLGSVVLAREISHEPLRRRFEEVVEKLATQEGAIREPLRGAQDELRQLVEETSRASVVTPGMSELSERISRTRTAIEYWLAVDDALAGEDYPDAQPLIDRMRVATARWPLPDRLPERVRALGGRVESYYESGENPKQPVL